MASTQTLARAKAEISKKDWSKRKGVFADIKVVGNMNPEKVVPFFLSEARKNDRKMARLPAELRGRSTIAFSNGLIRISVNNDNPTYEKFINEVAKEIVRMIRED